MFTENYGFYYILGAFLSIKGLKAHCRILPHVKYWNPSLMTNKNIKYF